MSTPSITPAQIVAALTALAGAVLVLFKLHLTDEQRAAFITIIGTIVPLGWAIADAIIRHGRSRALTLAPTASTVTFSATGVTPVPPDSAPGVNT